MPIMQDKNKPPQVNINPFGGGCDCRHDLDHLTPTERKSRLKYEHIQRCFSAATTVLAVMALLGAFLIGGAVLKIGRISDDIHGSISYVCNMHTMCGIWCNYQAGVLECQQIRVIPTTLSLQHIRRRR